MSFSQVNYMNIVTNTRSIWRIIIIAKYTKFFKFSSSYLHNIWHQVIWDSLWIFTNQTRFMRSNRIKITK